MTITIETPANVEAAIARGAQYHGVSPEEYILRAIVEKARAEGFASDLEDEEKDTPPAFPPGATWNGIPIEGNPLAALFAQWAADDPVTSPEDLAERTREGDAITAAIRANRFNIPQDPKLVAIVEEMAEWDRQAKELEGTGSESVENSET